MNAAIIAKWFIVGWLAMACIGTVLSIGKPVVPLTPGSAVHRLIPVVVMIVAIVAWWR